MTEAEKLIFEALNVLLGATHKYYGTSDDTLFDQWWDAWKQRVKALKEEA